MTLPIGNRTDATGNGSTNDYDYTFRILNEAHLLVTVRHPTTGVETTLTLTTDYTVDGVGDVGGGQIALVAGKAWMTAGNLTTDWHITIRGVEPLAQETDIRNQGDYYPEGIEDQFDYQMRIAQQQQDELDRSVKLPETVTASGFDTTLPADIASNPDATIVVNSAGTGLEMGPTSGDISGAQSAATAAIAAQGAAEDAQAAAEIAQAAAEAAASSMVLASQAEAEAGTENTKYLSSLRTKQAINANKNRVTTITSAAEPTINTDNCDAVTITALDEAITSMTTNLTGTPVNFQKLIVRIKDDGTNRAIEWGEKFVAKGVALPTTTTASKLLTVGFIYDTVAATFGCVASVVEA
jgi:hypothetical protein